MRAKRAGRQISGLFGQKALKRGWFQLEISKKVKRDTKNSILKFHQYFVKLQHEINFQIKIYPTVLLLLLLVVFWKPTCHKNRGRIRHLLPLREAPFLKLYVPLPGFPCTLWNLNHHSFLHSICTCSSMNSIITGITQACHDEY